MKETLKDQRNYNPFIVASFGTIVLMWILSQQRSISYELQFYSLMISVLYIASHRSLGMLVEEVVLSHDGKTRKAVEGEVVKKEDAMFLASASIFTFHLALKYLDNEIVNTVLSFYLRAMGCLALTVTMIPFFSLFFLKEIRYQKKVTLPTFFEKDGVGEFSFDVSLVDLISFCLSGILSIVYYKSEHWALNNVFGIAFCMQGIERFSNGDYKNGALLLGSLFAYDLYGDFRTDVVSYFTKGLDGPIKILFPNSIVPNAETGTLEFSLLGVGDIVIPGLFLALLLRFDAYKFYNTCQINATSHSVIHASFPKPYFHTTFATYIIGLVVIDLVKMHLKSAQPTFFYLVPACLCTSFLCATIKGDVKELLAYSEYVEKDDTVKGSTKRD